MRAGTITDTQINTPISWRNVIPRSITTLQKQAVMLPVSLENQTRSTP